MVKAAKSDDLKQYIHDNQKRVNNPPVGLVTAETDRLHGKKGYHFDPHLDPNLQWSGKVENQNFDVDTVSLHVHERIDPLTIIEAVRKKKKSEQKSLFHYFEAKENNPSIREAIEFYKHSQGWSNRLIAGDSLLVMNSLLEKENLSGKVQSIYMDPPYGIKYGSNFQPFINKRDVKDGKDEDLTQEPETIRAFRDTWELGIHSYLTYIRNRLLLSRELLNNTGSCFVQIGEQNIHLIRILLDEVFGAENFMSIITFRVKNMPFGTKYLENMYDYILWYAKEKKSVKFHRAFSPRPLDPKLFTFVELEDGSRRKVTSKERRDLSSIPEGARLFTRLDMYSSGYTPTCIYNYEFEGTTFKPRTGKSWKTTKEGMAELERKKRLMKLGSKLYFIFYYDDYPYTLMTNFWDDTAAGYSQAKRYVVETHPKVIQRCLLLTTDPGDIVLDPTCGSGTTAFVAEKLGRRWITCDTSRVAITLAKQRLMTAIYEYYRLAYPNEGVSSGFSYKTAQHVTLGSLAQNEPPSEEILYDQPMIDKSITRITGPFTIEAVPSQRVKSFEEIEANAREADATIARSGQTLRQNEWIDEMLSTGVRGKGNQKIRFVRIETLCGTRWVHAQAETKDGKKAVLSFGPEYAPLERRQVELAIEEAQELVPKPKLVIFASFQFDPEAAKDIDALKWPGVDVLKVQMNTDLLTSDLKKKRSSNESFWLVGQPDIELEKQGSKYVVRVKGFDYYNTRKGEIESGDSSKIAMWELDTNYDGRSIYPKQVFFPMAGTKQGWNKLAKNLKAQIDEEMIEKYRGTESLPFEIGNNSQIAVKIIDDRGLESVKIIRVKK